MPEDLKEFFKFCVHESFKNKELLKQFDRLQGTSLSKKGLSPIEIEIDKITGKQDDDMKKFIKFVDQYIFQPLVTKQFSDFQTKNKI